MWTLSCTMEKPITLSRPSRVTGKLTFVAVEPGDNRVRGNCRGGDGEVVGENERGDVGYVAGAGDREVDRVGRGRAAGRGQSLERRG